MSLEDVLVMNWQFISTRNLHAQNREDIVLMKDIVTPVPPEEVRGMIKKCLETAALVNYTRLSAEAKIEDWKGWKDAYLKAHTDERNA
uniref:Uncharacterized protein n=1 Tax=Timema poppense TaxID=170557 RepID=A0A7R9CEX4_TIMPO|nr:unnamed protein product [Timema poppensis]